MNIDEFKKEIKNIINDIKTGNIKKQIANFLTIIRLLAPFVLIPLIYLNKLKIFLIMIILFCLTDTFDGYFARKYNSVSLFGTYLDCLVDKIFVLTLLIPIVLKFGFNYINLIIINIILEVIIIIVNIYAFIKKLNPKSNIYGKIKTYFIFILLCLLYLNKIFNLSNIFLIIFILITIILQIISIISYIIDIIKKKNKK